jgi:DNA mismatch repair protein MutS
MMQQYAQIKSEAPDCLLFYRMGDFYELFYEDALIGAKVLEIALTKRNQSDGADVPMCGVPVHAYEHYVTKLITKGHRVAICEQLETPEEAKKRGVKGPIKRGIVRVITPGTLVDENLLQSAQSNFLACLYIEPKTQEGTLAYVDISTGDFYVEPTTAHNIVDLLARINPAEILCPEPWHTNPANQPVIAPWRLKFTPLPNARFDAANASKRLMDFYGVTTLEGFALTQPHEYIAAGTVLDYVYLTQKQVLPHLRYPHTNARAGFLVMDAATRTNLEVFTPLSRVENSSLFSTLNATQTALGTRLLADFLARPALDCDVITQRLDCVSFLVDSSDLRSQARHILAQVPDIERALARILMGRLSPRDVGSIRQGLHAAKALYAVLAPKAPAAMQSTLEIMNIFEALATLLEKALSATLPPHTAEGGYITEGFDETLDALRSLSHNSQTALKALEAELITQTGIPNLRIRHNNIIGYHIEVTPSNLSKVPETFILRQTLSTSSRFTVPALIELEKAIASAKANALEREHTLFLSLTQPIEANQSDIRTLARSLAFVDVMAAFAHIAHSRGYTRPHLVEEATLFIHGGRHPIIESLLPPQEPFTPNDCHLAQGSFFQLITGPNMAGKSTYLRQNALIIIMAHIGSFVPAAKATIGLTDRIFSRIGASDDLAGGRSTFMVEMVETATILHQATARSFVILDEVGRGTATFDGMALAFAIAEHLHNNTRCRTLFTTHYHELTRLEDTLANLQCLTMHVHEGADDILFMHKVIPGRANKSYGVHVAALAGIPKAVTTRAQALLHSFEHEHSQPKQHVLPFMTPPKPALEPSAVEAMLHGLDVNTLTPLEALNRLHALKLLANEKPQPLKDVRAG